MLAAPCADGTALATCGTLLTTGSTTTQTATSSNGLVGSLASSAWDAVCTAFGDAAVAALKAFAQAFASFPSINPQDAGITSVYSISLGIAAVVSALLLLLQIVRTVVTHDGTGLARAITGLGTSALAFLLTLAVSAAAISAANDLTQVIIDRTFTNTAGLQAKLTALFVLSAADGTSPTLVMVLAVVAILLTLVLWFELLLANAAVAVLIGTSPIAAAGQVSAVTAGWWPKLVSATIQLIILKPVIALVFAVGFSLAGNSTDLAGNMTGLLVLLLAVLAWPAIARFFTFASVSLGGGRGLAALLGFAAGRVNGAASAQTAPGAADGAAGDDFAAVAAQRSMATHAARSGATGSSVAAGGAGAGGGAAAAAGPAGLVAAAVLDAAQRGVNALTGRMEQTARHAGLDGANPHPYPAGYPRHAPVPIPRSSPATTSGGRGGSGGDGGSPPGPGAGPAERDLTWPDQTNAPQMAPTGDTMPTAPSATPGPDNSTAVAVPESPAETSTAGPASGSSSAGPGDPSEPPPATEPVPAAAAAATAAAPTASPEPEPNQAPVTERRATSDGSPSLGHARRQTDPDPSDSPGASAPRETRPGSNRSTRTDTTDGSPSGGSEGSIG